MIVPLAPIVQRVSGRHILVQVKADLAGVITKGRRGRDEQRAQQADAP